MGSDILAALPPSRPGYVPPADNLVKLNQNESPYGLAPDERDALLAALRDVPLHRYPDPGHTEVERAIARRAGVAPDMVVAGNGANELVELLVRATCDPGDEVLTVAPTYHLYDRFCAVNRARLVKARWGGGFAFPREELARSISARTRLVLLCRPNNPTGHLYPADEVLAVARAFPGPVAVDEAYCDFAGDTLTGALRAFPNLVLVRSLSKAYAAAGLRFGYLLAGGPMAEAVRRVQTPYGVGGLTQAAALFLVTHPEIMERHRRAILAERADLARRLDSVRGLTTHPSATNFVLVRTDGSADALDAHLRARGIVVRNLHWEDRYLRVSVGTAADHARLEAALHAFGTAAAGA